MPGQDDSSRRPPEAEPADTVRLPRQTGRPRGDSDATSRSGDIGIADDATARKGDDMRADDTSRRPARTGDGHKARDVRTPRRQPTEDRPTQDQPTQDQPTQDQPVQDHRSLGQLVASASRDLSTLVRDEIALAKAELKESATAAGKGAGLFGAAAFLGYVAFLMLSIAAGYGLVAAGLHPAWSFLIVAGAYILVAAIIAYVGMRNFRKAGPPKRTIHSIDEAKAIVGRGNHR
jgi:Putative Actinobacterial Holin-X, holin superfamily III